MSFGFNYCENIELLKTVIKGDNLLLSAHLHVGEFPNRLLSRSKHWQADMGEFLAHFEESDSEDGNSGEPSMLLVNPPPKQEVGHFIFYVCMNNPERGFTP